MPSPLLQRGAFARLGFAAAIALSLFIAAGLAHAENAPACEMTTADAAALGRRAAAETEGGVFRDYSDAEAARLLAIINAQPPATRWRADRILTLELPGARVVLALALGDCEFVSFTAAPAAWDALRDHALGQPL